MIYALQRSGGTDHLRSLLDNQVLIRLMHLLWSPIVSETSSVLRLVRISSFYSEPKPILGCMPIFSARPDADGPKVSGQTSCMITSLIIRESHGLCDQPIDFPRFPRPQVFPSGIAMHSSLTQPLCRKRPNVNLKSQ